MDRSDVSARIESLIEEVNDHFGLPWDWQLQHTVNYNEIDPEEESLQAPTVSISLHWGNPEVLPNGSHGVRYRTEQLDIENLREQVFKTALQSALVLGRDQELREAGINPSQPPIWARVSRPIFAKAFEAHARITDPMRAHLGQQQVEENGAILAPRHGYRLDESTFYFFDWWKGEEKIELQHEIPESILANISKMKLCEVLSIPGVDLAGINASIEPIYDEFGDPYGLEIDLKRSELVRLAPAPQGLETDPVKAWLAAARRT